LVFAQTLDDIDLSDSPNIWSYRWGHSFSPKRAYLHLVGPRQVHQAYKWLWKSSVQKRHKVFFWLLLKDRLSTRNILRRRNKALPSYECVLCNLHVEETLEHFFCIATLLEVAGHLYTYLFPLGSLYCPHFFSSAASPALLYGCHHNHELVYLDGPQQLHLQRVATLFAVGQGLLSKGICSSYSQSKS
jgi:hypothetical protein